MGLLTQLLAEKHQKNLAKDQQQFDAYKTILSNPNATDDGKEYALTQLLTLSGAGDVAGGKSGGGSKGGGIGGKAGKGIEAIVPVFKHLLGIGGGKGPTAGLQGPAQGQPQQPQAQAQQPQAPPTAGTGGPVPGMVGVKTGDIPQRPGGGAAVPGMVGVTQGDLQQRAPQSSQQTPQSPQPAQSPRVASTRPPLLMTASERLKRDQEAAKQEMDLRNSSSLDLHNKEADADQSRQLNGVGQMAEAKKSAYDKLVAGGMDKVTAASVLGIKEPPPATVKRLDHVKRIGQDGQEHSYTVKYMTDGQTSEEEEKPNSASGERPVAGDMKGTIGELAAAQNIITTGKHSDGSKATAGDINAAKMFVKNYDAGTNAKVQVSVNASSPTKPGTLQYWTDYFNNTRQMPPYGVLKANPRLGKDLVDNIAATSGGADTTVAKAAMTDSLHKALVAQQGVLAQVTPYEQTAGANMDRAINNYQKLSTLNSPILNKPYRTWQREFQGKPELASAEAARVAAVSEVSNVLKYGKGVISDEAYNHASNLLNENYNLKSMVEAAKTLHKDMTTRINAQRMEVQVLNRQLGGKDQSKITMIDPTGKEQEVSEGDVQHYVDRGAKVK